MLQFNNSLKLFFLLYIITFCTANMAISQESSGKKVIEFTADYVTYDLEKQIITANGRVKIVQNNRTLFADTIIYNKVTQVIVASGNISFIEPTGDVIKAKYLELDDEFSKGFVKVVTVLFSDKSRGSASLATKEITKQGKSLLILDNATYTPCKICIDHPDEPPFWQITAAKIIYNDDDIEYKNAKLDIFGVPIIYTPYFTFPNPNIKRKSGFLSPHIGFNDLLGGIWLSMPYFWAVNPANDITITPVIVNDHGFYNILDWRGETTKGTWSMENSIAFDNDNQSSDPINGHVFANGQFTLDDNWSYGFQLQRTTNDDYLKIYGFRNSDFLTTQPFIDGYFGRSSVSFTAYSFQGLLSDNDEKTTPLILPLGSFNYITQANTIGGRVEINGSALALWREVGEQQRRLSFSTNWQNTYSRSGLLITPSLSVRGDYYNTQNVLNNAGQDISGQVMRFLPKAAIKASYPLLHVSSDSHQVIEPIAEIVLSPSLANSEQIGNEDSQGFVFDKLKLLSLDRFPGHDMLDSGSRLVVGGQFSNYWESGQSISAFIGQSYRLSEGSVPYQDSGINKSVSDYVGSISFFPVDWLSIEHYFRLDANNLQYKVADLQSAFGNKDYRLILGYTYIPQPALLNVNDYNDQEISLSTYANFYDDWYLYTNIRQNIGEGNKLISLGSTLYYVNDCIELGLEMQRNDTQDGDIGPNNSISLVFRLRNIN